MKGRVHSSLVVFLVLFTAFCLVQCFAAQETVTITTYYPSPFGVYRDLNMTGRLFMTNIGNDGNWNNAIVFTNLSASGDNSSIKLVDLGGSRSEFRIETWNSAQDRIYIGGARGFNGGFLADGLPAGGLIVNAAGNATLSGVYLEHGTQTQHGCVKMAYASDSGTTTCPSGTTLNAGFSPGVGTGGYFFCCDY